MTIRQTFFLLLLLPCLTGCRIHRVCCSEKPPVSIPEEYYHEHEGCDKLATPPPLEWWKAFGVPELNTAVETALANNLEISGAWSRLAQADAVAVIESSEKIPQIDLDANYTYFRDKNRHINPPIAIEEKNWLLGGRLFYEVDLWRRIKSKALAAEWAVVASSNDVDTTALVVSGVVTDLWFTIQEQRELETLINTQAEINRTLLDLLELRFSVGESSALDVYQQRVTLTASEAELPPIESNFEVAQNALNIVMGQAPQTLPMVYSDKALVDLPPFPQIGNPMDLVHYRPDLRAAYNRVLAADYAVAAAIADRLPKLTLFLTQDFVAQNWANIFERTISTIIGDLITPIIDGNRRAAEVERRKAVVSELLANFGQQFLVALGEVEDAIVEERYQLELIKRLDEQMQWSRLNLSESQSRYMNGLTDYLNVIAAIQSLQNLERRMISERNRLILIRARLYRALGGFSLTQEECYA